MTTVCLLFLARTDRVLLDDCYLPVLIDINVDTERP